ncbi:MAG: thioredoxin domain-containing protein [Myxococcota bacterium]
MRRLSIAPLALALAVLACQQPQDTRSSAADTTVVATLNGKNLTAGELREFMKDDLYKREVEIKPEAEVFDAKAEALDAMVDEMLVAQAAKQAGQTPEAFVEAQVLALGPVTDVEVKQFFDENVSRLPPGSTLDGDLAPRIKAHLESQRARLVSDNLRAAAKVTVLIQPPRTNIEATGPSRGPADAPIVIVAFSDYQCPFCKRAEPTIDAVLAKYPTQVRLVFRHLPLDALHPNARTAAIASVCAEQQGKFWEYHNQLFQNQQALTDEDLIKYATAVGLDMNAFKTCQTSPAAAERVQKDAETARMAGITGTPAFFINGILISGAQPIEAFQKWIDSELATGAMASTAPAS